VASFDSPVEDGAALADERTLVAITGGRTHLAAVDLVRGTTTTRAAAPVGRWLGPPAARGGNAYLLLLTPTSDFALGVDASGAETFRVLLGTHPPPLAPEAGAPAPIADGGAPALVAGPHTPPLVDSAGTLAFATPHGSVGVIALGIVDTLADACAAPTAAALVAGAVAGSSRLPAAVTALVPLSPGVFLAACHSGTLLAIRGDGG
jgi:hypothetical protein